MFFSSLEVSSTSPTDTILLWPGLLPMTTSDAAQTSNGLHSALPDSSADPPPPHPTLHSVVNRVQYWSSNKQRIPGRHRGRYARERRLPIANSKGADVMHLIKAGLLMFIPGIRHTHSRTDPPHLDLSLHRCLLRPPMSTRPNPPPSTRSSARSEEHTNPAFL